MGLEMFCLLVMVVAVIATVGEGHRGQAQRQGHRQQQYYGQLSGQLLTSFLCAFSIQAQAWEPSVGALGGLCPPVCLPSSVSRYPTNEHDAPRLARYHRAFHPLTTGNSGQGNCPSPREFGHLLVSTQEGVR